MLVGSSRFRWVPLALLSIWAASDLALQYALASTNLPDALGISKHQLQLIKVKSAAKPFWIVCVKLYVR